MFLHAERESHKSEVSLHLIYKLFINISYFYIKQDKEIRNA